MSSIASSVAGTVARLRAAGCVFAEDEAALLHAEARSGDHLESMIARRTAGAPLEHVLGWATFAGVRVAVTDGVFVPRHRTELLTTTARSLMPVGTVLDLCCGTGALGLVVTRGHPEVRLVATDVDPRAVECARRNLASSPVSSVYCGDLFEPLPPDLRGTVEILLANVPYVPTAEIAYLPEEFRVHEARAALDGGPDGLDILRRVAREAPAWLAPGGTLLTEAGVPQLAAAREILSAAGLAPHVVTDPETETTVLAAVSPV
ncbi:putative protein N(5)-glutamine methyltransferase [Dactylosporangium sp. AC04546]|uniref:putative protein N(5)-glutamine methyltransferase n=1 Tax=Dactylosporangium sp. AC04546 TaxID=2862460 RepID=UPI001EDFC85A|nr:putative protein N(5)-glutamine methyltransferase [Dactylosporangium sp. AC04546]WVK86066.1 putative protein N(5)-glutamine methyltransferase [Dactylosporangium sp. AC04546]